MVSKNRRKIPASEWERHKQTITRLYLELPLKDVITEMEMKHDFKASVRQFKKQLGKVWGIRKNTKRSEWEAFFEGCDNMNLTAEFMRINPIGRKTSVASFKRAKLYVKPHSLLKQNPLPDESARNYIRELSMDIYKKLHRSIDTEDMGVLSIILPELVKAFAIRLYHDAPTPSNHRIMHFIHKRHQEIIAQLVVMFNHGEEEKLDYTQGHLGGMPLYEKMDMWNRNAGKDDSVQPIEELLKGVKDNEEDSIDQGEFFEYHNITINSPAYKWFLASLEKESMLQLGTAQPRIRQQILDKFSTGIISNQRNPDINQVTFELEWDDAMEESLRHENPEQWGRSYQPSRSSIILTGSPREAQGLTIGQYLAQTWPLIGLQLLSSLQAAVINHTHLHTADLAGDTRLLIYNLPSRLVVIATGQPYYVADFGEILAWIGSVLLSNTRNLMGFCLPLMTSFQIDSTPSNSTLQKYRACCKFRFEFTQPGTFDESLPGIQNFSPDLLGKNTIIQGFPIRRRPEGFPGLELSFETLLLYLEAPKAEILVLDVFIKGPKRVLKLVKHFDNVFLWRLDHSLADYSLCCPDHRNKAIAYKDYSYLSYSDLEAGRHILSKCADDSPPPKDPVGTCEEGCLVDTKTTQSRFVTEANLADGPGFPSRSSTALQNVGTLSILSKPQNDETALSPASIGSVHSVLENNPRSARTEDSNPLELLSQGSTMFSIDSQFSSTTESPEYSLDSDMFSISESSDDVELLNSQETIYPILNNVLHRLLSGFRIATQYQSSPDENRGNSGPVATTTEFAHTENASRTSQKRNLSPEKGGPSDAGEDGEDSEDGLRPPPPKKMKSGQGTKVQKCFACPYLKWDPIKYSRCCERKLSRIRDVKQHLVRKHTPEFYCQACQAANFMDDDSLQRHIKIGKCTRRDRAILDGISYQQRYRLSRKSKPNASEEEKWFVIWEILFPSLQRPSSVYLDANLTLEMRQFREYCERRGPAIMREHIESNPVWLGSAISVEQCRVYLDRVIAEGFNNLFNNWHSRTTSAVTSLEATSSGSLQQPGSETPTGSNGDSGGVIGSLSSSRESGSQGRQLPLTTGIREAITNTGVQNSSPVLEGLEALNPTHAHTFLSHPFGSFGGGQDCGFESQMCEIEKEFDSLFGPDFSNVDTSLEFKNISDFVP